MIFFIKKVMSPLLSPLSMSLFLALVGLFCLWATRKQKAGKILMTLSAVLLGGFSYGGVTDMLVAPLEQAYPPITDVEELTDVKWIVVLGGGAEVDPDLPPSTYLPGAALMRVSEGVYLHNRLPETKLVFTGRGTFKGVKPEAEVMASTAVQWGVKQDDIRLETEAKDTKDHPVYVKKIVGRDPFILVTSAVHMPRAMALFKNQGMMPIAAPTAYRVQKREALTPGVFFPNIGALKSAEMAIHEYTGLIWAWLRGQIG